MLKNNPDPYYSPRFSPNNDASLKNIGRSLSSLQPYNVPNDKLMLIFSLLARALIHLSCSSGPHGLVTHIHKKNSFICYSHVCTALIAHETDNLNLMRLVNNCQCVIALITCRIRLTSKLVYNDLSLQCNIPHHVQSSSKY